MIVRQTSGARFEKQIKTTTAFTHTKKMSFIGVNNKICDNMIIIILLSMVYK